MAEDGRRARDDRDVPYYYRRPRSRHRWVDAVLEAWFAFVGPAQGVTDRTPQRGPRTPEEAAAGYGDWERVTAPDGRTFLVPRSGDAPRE
ncbi:hypothetical protein CLV92_109157 [Kineococcus xinjiangensis]|uniref:Uncharacterized protein n=1 Tax=Kineococcus xinjiangensis TaxID=512762 RepID=A0A2S6II36_9ACTN|nr:hypothetical protein [Kineococcus xinjiangensis]PPK93879.1 hypothetical protein CLV92_109157 [Kineococcus xinjiangensis]